MNKNDKQIEKLEFKYWCSYLPHKPIVLHYDEQFKNGFEIHKLNGITEDLRYNPQKINKDEKHLLSIREITFWIENRAGLNNNVHNVKLALRPLSDLTKDIEVNGERFVPINELKHYYGFDYMWSFSTKPQGEFCVYAVEFACVNKLFEWNFDVFGLIEKGLAIDINTLTDEQKR